MQSFFERLRAKLGSSRPATVQISIPEPTYRLLSWAADKQEIPVEALVTKGLILAVPGPLRNSYVNNVRMARTLATLQDELPSPQEEIFSFPEEEAEELELEEPAEIGGERVPGHTCVHIRKSTLQFQYLKAGEVEGVCASPNNPGVPCMWTPGAAHNCQDFVQIRMPK